MQAEARTIRLAVALGDAPLRRWEHNAISHALAVPGVRLVAVLRAAPGPVTRTGFLHKFFHRFVHAAEGSAMLAAAPDGGMNAWPVIDEHGTGAGPPDAILFLGGGRPGPDPLHRAPFGCWCFEGPDGMPPGRIPPGTREALTGHAITFFALTDALAGTVLRRGVFPTLPGAPLATADNVLQFAANWPAQLLKELMLHGRIDPARPEEEGTAPPVPGAPTMWAHHVARFLTRAPASARPASLADWNIGLLHQPIHALLDEDASMNVRWFPPPSKGKGRMEPFGYRTNDGELNVLYSKTDGGTGRTTIARLRPKPDNILKRSRTMLDVGRDHAYPYVVMIDGAVHVLRTVRSENTTDLYRVNGGNDGLDPVAVLVDVALHAPTLFHHAGRWWLMGTQEPLADAVLRVFHGGSPQGPFTPHALDPVKCDVRSARPAGTPFEQNGVLWRPALDASDPARPAIVLNRVTSLAPDRFSEEPGRVLEGFPNTAYGRGVRTLCAMGEVTLVDGLLSPVLSAGRANASRGRSKRRRSSQHNDEE